MPNYIYRAKTKEGGTVSGMEFFEDERKLAEVLRSRDLILVSAAPVSALKRKFVFGKVPVVDLLMFTRNFRVMINAGMPISRILEILAAQVHSKKFATVILEINEKIKKGSGLAEAFTGWPSIFNDFYVSMIKTGESGSNLETVLAALEEQIRRDYELKSKIRSALIYPLVIVSALLGVGGMIIFFVMPRLAKAFAGLGVEMPLTLKIFIWLEQFLSQRWPLAIAALAAGVVLTAFVLKSRKFKTIRDRFVLNLPIFGNISHQFNTARFLRTFSSLIIGGVPVYQALNITADTLNNYLFKNSLKKTASEVQRGKFIHQSLDRKLWPPLVTEMVVVGEETGKLSDIAGQLAFFYEEEVANTVKNLSALIEPVLMIVIGLAIGVFAISVITPIYSIMGGF